MAKSIKLNLFFNIIQNITAVIFPLITAPYLARVLEPDGIGLFNFASTYASYFAIFAVLGRPFYAVREIAKIRDDIKKQEKFVSEMMSLTFVTTLIVSTVYVASVFIIPQMYENYVLFLVAALNLYITPLSIDFFYKGREEFGYITFRSLVMRILSIVLMFLFVREKGDLLYLVLINSLTTCLNIIWNFAKLKKTGVEPYFTLKFTRHIKPLLILFASNIAISVYTILDTLMLGFMTSYEEVGFYNNASHIAKSLLPIATSLAAVAMPRLSYYMKSGDWIQINDLMNKSLSIVSFLCFPMAMGVIAIAPTFVPLFYGELFYGAIIPLQIIVGIVIAIGLNNLLGIQVMIGLGYDKMFLYAVLVGTFSNFFANLALIPSFGAVGASIASVGAETLILLVEIVMVYKLTPIRFNKLREVAMCALIPLLYFPMVKMLDNYVSGWYLVGVFVVCGGLYYVLVQLLIRNSATLIFKQIIMNRLRNKKA